MAQQKNLSIEEIMQSETLQEIPIGKCINAGEKGEMMVCRTGENKYVIDGKGVQFEGKLKS